MPMDPSQQKACLQILNKMKRNPNSGPFLKPVDPVALNIPDYTTKISHPMDISTIKHKLDMGEYDNPKQFYDDNILMFENCYLYNGEENQISLMGKELQKILESNYSDDIGISRSVVSGGGKQQSTTSPPNSNTQHNNVDTTTQHNNVDMEGDEPKVIKRKIKSPPTLMEDYDAAISMMNEMEKSKWKKTTWPFLQPVTDEEAPNYSSVISTPMDLSMVRRKLEGREYGHFHEFLDDLQLIVKNCKKYNKEGTEIFRLGVEFEKFYKSLNKYNPDQEIEELRKKISEMTKKLVILEEAKNKGTNRHVYSLLDREKIGNQIGGMNREECDKVVEIIQRNCSNFNYVGNDEIEVNFHTLPDHVMGELDDFVKRVEKREEVREDH